jgi:hypothetical protein
MSALLSRAELEGPLVRALERELGPVDLVSEFVPFAHTQYYAREMGPDLRRRMISWRGLVAPDGLIRAKHLAEGLEDRFRDESGNRQVNLDPGLLGLHNFVLSTHKGYTHRIYLGQGVYADLTLVFEKGGFRPLPWTYPDYASGPVLEFLNLVRSTYLWQRRNLEG